eukprot:9032550-Ditylum_brightwellii.AAC.1
MKLVAAVLKGNFSNCRYRALGKKEMDGEGTAPKRVDTRIRRISVALFAYFGPYVVQISALFLGFGHAEEVSLVKPWGGTFSQWRAFPCFLLS